jgi:flagellar protein FliS
MQNAAHAYLQTNLTTNSPSEIILMLYDGALKFLKRAKEQMDARDYAGKGISISRTMDIINELSSVLNREQGKDLADNLCQLYFWCNTRLAMANLKMDKDSIDTVIKVLGGLRSAFAQIQNTPGAQEASGQLTARQEAEGGQRNRSLRQDSAASPPDVNAGRRGRNLYNRMAQS